MNKRIANLLSEFGFFVFGEFYGSLGNPAPLYINSKKLYSRPDKMKIVSDEISEFMKGKDFDLVAGTEITGTPLAMAVSFATQRPFIYVSRRKGKDGRQNIILKGLYQKGEKVLVVDDGIGSGETKMKFIEKLKRKGLIVQNVLVLYDAEIGHLSYYDQNGIKVYSLVKHNDLVRYMEENGCITKTLAKQMTDLWKKLPKMKEDKNKWEGFVNLAKSEGFAGG